MNITGGFTSRARSSLAVGLLTFAALELVDCSDAHGISRLQSKVTNKTTYIETGDLPQIRKRGTLRLLSPRRLEGSYLPRKGHPLDAQRELAELFANDIGLTPVFIHTDAHDQLIPFLLEGKGDVIVANMTVTAGRKKRVAFTSPVDLIHEQVITRAHDTSVGKLADLEGRRIALRRSSSFWKTIETVRLKHPRIKLQVVPEEVDTEAILHRVATGAYDVTVADSNLVEEVFAYRNDLRVAFDITRNRLIAWGVRPDATELRTALDRFLSRARVAEPHSSTYHDDLTAIKKRKILRVLTRNHPATYFLWRGELLGFEYELVREFAKEHALRVEMIVPPTWGDLITWLEQGRGDVIAASMTITKERKRKGLRFSRPYNYVSEMLIARKRDSIQSLEELTGRTVVVAPTTSYWQTFRRLQETGLALTLVAAPEGLSTSEIIAKVASGEYDLTVADSHLVDLELTWRDDIKGAFALGDPVPHGWAVYSGKPELLGAINAFLERSYRGTFYNITYKKYFKSPRRIQHVESRAARSGQLSPYDKYVRKYAERYGFDWRLITAQMYQESRFDPEARSWAGAHGLLQVLPRTARELGLSNLQDPATGIHAGVKYMAWLRERFQGKIKTAERTWFSLAAYNAGYGHVQDAQRLAEKLELDPNRWFGHVERAMLLLSKPKYYKQARFGYVRGGQPVHYVREIKQRYEAYTRAAPL